MCYLDKRTFRKKRLLLPQRIENVGRGKGGRRRRTMKRGECSITTVGRERGAEEAKERKKKDAVFQI